MFARQKKSKQDYFICIVNALQKEKIGNYDYLEEIKLDLEEHIPLAQKKVEYLKTCMPMLKEKKGKTQSDTESEKDVNKEELETTPQKAQPTKKPLFDGLFGKKNKQNVDNSETSLQPQKSDTAKQVDTQKLMQNTKKTEEPKLQQDSQDAHVPKKKGSFFKFFNKEKQNKKSSSPKKVNEQKTIQNDDNAEGNAGFTKPDDVVSELDITDYEIPPTSEIQEHVKIESTSIDVESQKDDLTTIDTSKKSQLGIKEVLDEINKETEILRTDIEEAKQLDDIKELLKEISKEKERLKANVEEIKTRFSVKPLVKKYDELEQKLQISADSLYSIQSSIYERIKEIRILRKDLSVIKEELDSL